MRLTVHAHAKINWSLAVCSERENGYHNLDMLMQRVSLCDVLIFEDARWLTLTVSDKRIPIDDRNLVIRAANALNDLMGQRKGAKISLRKNIPSRAGLGGGSADCAAALLALNRLWGFNLPLRTLMKLGEKLGADVPYCLQDGFARVTGIGEIIEPLEKAPSYPIVLTVPGCGLSTPEVFKKWNELGGGVRAIDNARLAELLVSGDLKEASVLSRNDLEAPAFALMPQLRETMERFKAAGAPFVRMSGSGSCVYAAFSSEEDAERAQRAIPGSMLVRTV